MSGEEWVIGFDVGTRRIGAAIGSRRLGSARALAVLPARGGEPDWSAVARLLAEWQPRQALVGWPRADDGGEQAVGAVARRFAGELAARFGLTVALVDERLSSREAARRFAELRRQGLARRRDARALDALAARVLVEQWLAEAA